ncbi:MAG TPA: hypothetical protein VMI55_05310 [Thermoplasmata archaeon]|nr:hypothetical protein [Thermoplasmata archaeon]
MLTAADLEVNVLEFRQRSFQFDRIAEWDGEQYAVFSRTETESESQFRPRLVHLHLVLPLGWVVLDEANDELRIAPGGGAPPPRLIESVVEVGAEPPQFREAGVEWTRIAPAHDARLYAPSDRAKRLLSPEARAALGT